MSRHERGSDQSLLTWSGPDQVRAPRSGQSVSHSIVSRLFLALLVLAGKAHAGIVEDVRLAIAKNNFTLASSIVQDYEAQHGDTPELSEAISWIGRAALASQQLDLAEKYAQQSQSLVTAQLKSRSLDSDSHLPLALGAALEVQAQVLTKRGEKQEAIALLEKSLQSYGNTSIRARLQKNLNLLTLVGRAAPALQADRYLPGPRIALAATKGLPVLLFFWPTGAETASTRHPSWRRCGPSSEQKASES